MINKRKKKSNPIRSFVEEWNRKYPLDKWWRDKYNIPFGTQQHSQQNLIDMRIDYEEEAMYGKMLHEYKESNRNKEEIYEPGKGNWIKKRKPKEVTQEDIDRDFDRLSLDNMPQPTKGENGKRQIIL